MATEEAFLPYRRREMRRRAGWPPRQRRIFVVGSWRRRSTGWPCRGGEGAEEHTVVDPRLRLRRGGSALAFEIRRRGG
jgi:hypothetical protein